VTIKIETLQGGAYIWTGYIRITFTLSIFLCQKYEFRQQKFDQKYKFWSKKKLKFWPETQLLIKNTKFDKKFKF